MTPDWVKPWKWNVYGSALGALWIIAIALVVIALKI